MATRFKALLIGNAVFDQDPHNLPALKGPPNDLKLLHEALTHAQVGIHAAEDVTLLLDRNAMEIKSAMERFYAGAGRDDQLLLYYTGHGRQDIDNNLYLCGRDTQTDLLVTSSISSDDIRRMMSRCASQRRVIILDCCHSGSFKGGELPESLRIASGCFVLTSCRGQTLSEDATEIGGCSAFTRLLVEGLLAADADTNHDSFITLDEVYNYLLPKLTAATKQIPQRYFGDSVGEVPIGRSRPRAIIPAIPSNPATRPPMPARPVLAISAAAIEQPRVRRGDKLPVEIIDVYNEGEGTLDWTATTEESWIQLETGEGFVRVRLEAKETGTFRGNIYVRDQGRGGSKRISVFLEVIEPEAKPLLEVTPLTVDFGMVRTGTRVSSQVIHLTNRGTGELRARAQSNNPQLRLTTTDEAITIEPDTTRESSLVAEIQIRTAGGEARVNVNGRVETGPVLAVVPGQMLDFGELPAGKPASQVVRIGNSGSGMLNWHCETQEKFFRVDKANEGLRVTLLNPAPGAHLGSLVIRSNGGDATLNVRAKIQLEEPPMLPVQNFAPSRPLFDLNGWWIDQQMARMQVTGIAPNYQYILYNAFGAQVGSGTMVTSGNQAFLQGTSLFMPFTAQVQIQNPMLMSGTVSCLGMNGPLMLQRT
jgi:hypothetical protein